MGQEEPASGEEFKITIKRQSGGRVSLVELAIHPAESDLPPSVPDKNPHKRELRKLIEDVEPGLRGRIAVHKLEGADDDAMKKVLADRIIGDCRENDLI